MRRYRNFKRKRREKKGYGVRRTIYSNDDAKNSLVKYSSNYVQTTRYNILTFLPKNLWEQFHRVANVFFVFLMILTLTPISPVIPGPTVAAVVAILTFQAIKDAWEDYKRYKSDIQVNSRKLTLVDPVKLQEVEITWDKLKVGDIIRVNVNTEIPADLLLLSTSRPDGQCFVETANLDGETNLKLRCAHPQTSEAQSVEKLAALRLEVDADEPCAKLYEFDGSIIIDGEDEMPLTIDNFLHRGVMLRNTEFAYGMVLYTGHQTKFMLNISDPRHKMSKMEHMLNQCVIGLIFLLIILCVISAIIGTVVYQYDITTDSWFIEIPDESGAALDTLKSFLTFLVVYGNLIPLSLYVNLEITRLFQSRMLEWDARMYCVEKKTMAIARSTNLMEELGQIEYIFSDKTGTLTRNEMAFRVCNIGGIEFGEIPSIAGKGFDEENYMEKLGALAAEAKKAKARAKAEKKEAKRKKKFGWIRQEDDSQATSTVVAPDTDEDSDDIFDVRLNDFLQNADSRMTISPPTSTTVKVGNEEFEIYEEEQSRKEVPIDAHRQAIHDFFVVMAICNTVVPSKIDGATIYQSSSPDETALVLGAKKVGMYNFPCFLIFNFFLFLNLLTTQISTFFFHFFSFHFISFLFLFFSFSFLFLFFFFSFSFLFLFFFFSFSFLFLLFLFFFFSFSFLFLFFSFSFLFHFISFSF
jgi:phospholipid-translocating P-type ATPase (flippase)